MWSMWCGIASSSSGPAVGEGDRLAEHVRCGHMEPPDGRRVGDEVIAERGALS